MAIERKKKKTSQNLCKGFQWNFTGMFFEWRLSIRILQLMLICWKTWPPVDKAFLPYMAIAQTSKVFFSESVQWNFTVMFFWWLSNRFLWIVLNGKKKWLDCRWGIIMGYFCPIYGYSTNFKNLLRICLLDVKYSRTSMARTSLGPWKFVRGMDSSSHWGFIMAPGQEASSDNLGKSFQFSTQ